MGCHVMHSPRGAGASLVFGAPGDPAGLMQGEAFLPERDLYVGVRRGDSLVCLPFFKAGDAGEEEERFDINASIVRKAGLHTAREYRQTLGIASDTWESGGLSFTVYTPADGLVDPGRADAQAFSDSLLPAVLARLTLVNDSSETAYGFFGSAGMEGVYPLAQNARKLVGAGCANGFGFAALADGQAVALADFSPKALMSRRKPGFYQNCAMGALEFPVPPHGTRTLWLAVGWYQGGFVTRGTHRLRYAYTHHFDSLEQVLERALDKKDTLVEAAGRMDLWLSRQPISAERQHMLALAVHNYWASTQLFADSEGALRYVVNEGSYMMMNTLDLSVDHLFYECSMQPWTVRNQLESFAREYLYRDTVHAFGGSPGLPGGISFCHDQGSFGSFAPPGHSAYEMPEKPGCLSYMSQEQLCNWVLCAAVYGTMDSSFANEYAPLLKEALQSMMNRDHPTPALRDGVMDFDGDRCGTQWEITTYDSLDDSLSQARRSSYLAVKCFGTYLALETLLIQAGEAAQARVAADMARLCAETLEGSFDAVSGCFPAILGDGKGALTIPVIEGLCYPYFFAPGLLAADGPYARLLGLMRQHLNQVLQPGRCLFDDGGWRLSAGSINTWMSKIFLCEFVAERILGREASRQSEADRSHLRWWLKPCARCPGIDQVCWNQEYGRGFHYPRAITSILWTVKEPRLA